MFRYNSLTLEQAIEKYNQTDKTSLISTYYKGVLIKCKPSIVDDTYWYTFSYKDEWFQTKDYNKGLELVKKDLEN